MKVILILLTFSLIWAICDRLREIAIFPKWVSIFKGWWDKYFTPDKIKWNPFRDGYHFWKNVIVYIYCILVGVGVWQYYDNLVYGVTACLFAYGFWAVGQAVGLIFKKDKK